MAVGAFNGAHMSWGLGGFSRQNLRFILLENKNRKSHGKSKVHKKTSKKNYYEVVTFFFFFQNPYATKRKSMMNDA